MKTLYQPSAPKKYCTKLIICFFFLTLLSGCASTPKGMESLNAQPYSKCTKGMNLKEDGNGVLLSSIETDLIFDRFYLLAENNEGAFFLLQLEPRKFELPSKDMFENSRFDAKPYCYIAPSANYKISKVFAIFASSGPGGFNSTEDVYQYDISPIYFHSTPNKVTYLGRFLFLDQRMKEKGYSSRMSTFTKSIFSGEVIPASIEIDIIDKSEEDSDWGFDEYPELKNGPVENLSINQTKQIVQSKPFP